MTLDPDSELFAALNVGTKAVSTHIATGVAQRKPKVRFEVVIGLKTEPLRTTDLDGIDAPICVRCGLAGFCQYKCMTAA